MVVPENVALAAYRREPEDRGVVEAWVESGGDANGRWDAEDHGGPMNVNFLIGDPEMRGDPLLLMTVFARGRARRRSLWDNPTPHFLVRLFDPSLPNGVFWHVLSYWRETG